jgi:hypothetical protein
MSVDETWNDESIELDHLSLRQVIPQLAEGGRLDDPALRDRQPRRRCQARFGVR